MAIPPQFLKQANKSEQPSKIAPKKAPKNIQKAAQNFIAMQQQNKSKK